MTRNHETYDWNVNACTCCCGRYSVREGVTRSWRLYIESSIMTSCFADCLKVSSYRSTQILLFSMFKHRFLTTNMIVIIKVGSINEKGLSRFTVYQRCLQQFNSSLSLLRRTTKLHIVNLLFFPQAQISNDNAWSASLNNIKFSLSVFLWISRWFLL